MIGLMYVIFFVVYFAISWGVILAARSWAYNNDHSERMAGVIAGIFMFMLIFGDWIPVVVYHKYLCETQAGFWEYKTPEDWIKENPQVIDQPWGPGYWNEIKIKHDLRVETPPILWLSSDLYYLAQYNQNYSHGIRKSEFKLIDAKNGFVLAKAVEFGRGAPSNLFAIGGTLTDYKLWLALGNRNCGKGEDGYLTNVGSLIDRFEMIVKEGKNEQTRKVD